MEDQPGDNQPDDNQSDESDDNQSGERWWWVCALYKAVHRGVPRRRHLCERTAFLIRARGHSEAERVATQVARSKEHEYLVSNGETCRWVFQRVEGFQSLLSEQIGQGTEVYWEFFERVDKEPTLVEEVFTDAPPAAT